VPPQRLGRGRVDVSIGSALDLFGGTLPYAAVLEWHRAQQAAPGSPAAAPAPSSSAGGGTGSGSASAAEVVDTTIHHDPAPPEGGSGVFYVAHAASPAGRAARLTYTRTVATDGSGAAVLDLRSTVVEEVLRGKGIAGALCVAAFDYAAAVGARVVPTCSYIRDNFVPKHPRYAALVLGAAA
jgi:predicted GNAT family acetyltransferase